MPDKAALVGGMNLLPIPDMNAAGWGFSWFSSKAPPPPTEMLRPDGPALYGGTENGNYRVVKMPVHGKKAMIPKDMNKDEGVKVFNTKKSMKYTF